METGINWVIESLLLGFRKLDGMVYTSWFVLAFIEDSNTDHGMDDIDIMQETTEIFAQKP